MIFSNKELVFLSTLPVTIWGMITVLGVIFSELTNADRFLLIVHFDKGINLIIICCLYALTGLTMNRSYEIYKERQLRR